jgi:hypothetical protein
MNYTLLLVAVATVCCCFYVAAAPVKTGQCLPEKLCDGQSTSCKTGQNIRIVAEITNQNLVSQFYAYCLMVDQLTQITLVGCKIIYDLANQIFSIWIYE